MSRQQDSRVEFPEIADCALHLAGITGGKVVAAYNSMQRHRAPKAVDSMSGAVDDTGMTAAGEHDNALV